MPEQVFKSGEEWLRISLIPHKRGMLVEVRTHPLVEDFIQAMGNRTAGVEEWVGRQNGWEAVDEAERIMVYRSDALVRDNSTHFTLNSIGTNIVDDGGRINLSFLRIAGISNGVRFISTKDVFTAAELPGVLDDEGRLVLVRRLVREGALTFT